MTTPLQNGEDVRLFHDEVLLGVHGDLGTGIFSVEDDFADLHFHRLILGARAHGNDGALLRFLLCVVRDVKAPGGHRLGLLGLDDDSCS